MDFRDRCIVMSIHLPFSSSSIILILTLLLGTQIKLLLDSGQVVILSVHLCTTIVAIDIV